MTCPICQKPTEKPYRPFCSKRCADIDLAKWLNEDYAVPAREEDPFSEDAEAQSNPSDRLH
ncbi:DNA gyrase inhibitor YacG [Cognatishimia sp. D5M38]|uniref:DNA gyrase inhibitor YacG n=1 Tax=Cognatishimia coralii TaxID=3083254 RepID=A0ABU8QFT2_9RHOB